MKPHSSLTGGCSCGHVRYRLATHPLFVNACHCTICQRHTGSAFVINAAIETAHIECRLGTSVITETPSGSGIPQRIHRCPTCSTALWSTFRGRHQISFLRVGTLDTPALLLPGAHVHTRSKLPWIILPETVPSFPGYYDPAQIWPPESLARFNAAVEKV